MVLRLNNSINSPTVSPGWTAFTTIISATTTPPTPGTIAVNTSSYFLMGKMLYLKYYFYQTNNGSGGSGIYLFSIPPGFTINTTVVPTNSNLPNFGAALCYIQNGGASNTGIGTPYFFDSTHYAILANASGSTTVQAVTGTGVGWYSIQGQIIGYSVSIEIPIL